MKVIHVPFCYWPDPAGGTEVYVDSLARQQTRQGVEVTVAAPASQDGQYSHNGLNVRRFAVSQEARDLRDLYGEGDACAAEAFGRIVDEERPDVVHLHAFTQGVSLRLVREARRRGIPVVFSYHTPTVSCQRGTLLRWGSQVCDGVLDVTACTRCALHGHGLNRIASVLAGSIPSAAGRILGVMGASGGMWTAARMTELVRIRQQTFHNLTAEVDHIVALCQWVKEVLLRNGVSERKLTVSRQGLDLPVSLHSKQRPLTSPIRIAFFGRLHPGKGVHIVLQALRLNPDLRVRLDIFGVVQGEAGENYQRSVRALATGDTRINCLPPIPSGEVVARLKDYHVLAVPSQGLETGPRVVLEAFAAGVPVIGSNLGGIAELVQHEVDGLLVEPRSVDGWARAIRAVCDAPALLAGLRSGIRPPRDVRTVAGEMNLLYARELARPIDQRALVTTG